MKEGVFEETVEILEDYILHENFVMPAMATTQRSSPVKVKSECLVMQDTAG